jgi:hypothetical protein
MLAFCLLFDKEFCDEGWIACDSILRQDPSAKIYVLCLDDETLEKMNCRRVTCIPLSLLEAKYPELVEARGNREWPAYTQTAKVFLPTYVFDRFNEQAVCYVDSDVYFWAHPRHIDEAMGEHSFMVSSREDPIRPPQGAFNGGFFACRNDQNSRRFFTWWQQKCLEWCNWEAGPGGRYTEEGYLNVIADEPDRFPGAWVCQNPGVNLAKWNVHRHELEMADGEIRIILDGKWDLVFFHYKGFDPEHQWFGLGEEPSKPLRYIHAAYQAQLEGLRS